MKWTTVNFIMLILISACTDAEQMRLQLEELERQNRADSLMTNDSLALTLANYFDNHGTPNEKMRAHYILGRTYADMGETPQALDEYHKAVFAADTTAVDCNYTTLAKVFGQSAELYFWHDLFAEAIEANEKACHYAMKNGNMDVVLTCYEEIGQCYFAFGDIEKAEQIEKHTRNAYLEAGDTMSGNMYGAGLFYYNMQLGNVQEAKRYLDLYTYHSHFSEQKAIDSIKYEDWKYWYVDMGLYYTAIDKTDSAIYYYKKGMSLAKNINTLLGAYKGLFETYKKTGPSDSLSKYATLYACLNDTSVNRETQKRLQKQKAMLDYSHFQTESIKRASEARDLRFTLFMFILLSLTIILSLSLLFYRQHAKSKMMLHLMNAKYIDDMERYKKVKIELNMIIKEQKWTNIDLSQQIKCLEDQLNNIKQAIANVQADNTSPDEWNIKEDILETAIVEKCHRLALEGRTISDNDWQQLRTVINLYIPNFLKALDRYAYKPTLRETNVCILIKLRFLPSEIGFLVKMSPSNLANLRARLHISLFGVKGSTKEFDEKIQTLV